MRRLPSVVVASLVLAGTVAVSPAAAVIGTVPRPDHVVIVVEENHASTSILGNPDAPYINSLATSGANMTEFHAETHPSQPNYLALFSGSTQGVTTDACPNTFGTDNLGSQLISAGLGFTGYSEGLPSPGYSGCTTGRYARKHSPWVNFSNLAPTTNQPLTALPTDYSTLPQVSFVIPNLDDDMHDGTIAQGDQWLQQNLGGYIDWANTHNSLFMLTFDEDEGTSTNLIPTIITGQRVAPGQYGETANHYSLLRTIEDGYGLPGLGAAATTTPVTDIWTAPAGDQPPLASFTASCTALTCSFDASASSDPDGTIVSYAWTFGDGTTGAGVSTSHTYASGGPATVQLTVTDDQGAPGTTTQTVTPTAPQGAPFAADSFARSVASGWGTADVGGAWTVTGGASNFSVTPGAGAVRMAAANSFLSAYLAPARADTDLLTTFALDRRPIGGAVAVTVAARRVASGTLYDATVQLNANGTVAILLQRQVSSAKTTIAGPLTVAGLTYAAGTKLDVLVEATGTSPTTVRARIWDDAQAEPPAWALTATDSTAALQASGSVGITTYDAASVTNAPVTMQVSNLAARPLDQPPTAAFTNSCPQLTCTFDASGSTDPDGTITSYSWTFGDGATGDGVTPAHAYVASGDYHVVLTVTDDQGLSGTAAQDVTATAPPPDQPPVAVFTSSCTHLGCAFDGSASYDPEDVDVQGFAWDFGDGATATDEVPAHTYALAGTYQVTLTVSDDDGETGQLTQAITVADPPPFASDTFHRTKASGWGTADLGGTWSVSGTAPRSVKAQTARLVLNAGVPMTAFLGAVSRTDADVVVTFTADKVPTGVPMSVAALGRRVGAGRCYLLRSYLYPDGTVTLQLARLASNTETPLGAPVTLTGVTFTAGTWLTVRLEVTGTSPTTLRAKAWASDQPEPTTWQLSASDRTKALQAAGSVGVLAELPDGAGNAPVTASFASFLARPTD